MTTGKQTWTVWWWDDRDTDVMPVPMARTFDSKREALGFANQMVSAPPPWLGWVKVFRTDNEGYVAFRWSQDPPPPDPQQPDPPIPPTAATRRDVLWMLAVAGLAVILIILGINVLVIR